MSPQLDPRDEFFRDYMNRGFDLHALRAEHRIIPVSLRTEPYREPVFRWRRPLRKRVAAWLRDFWRHTVRREPRIIDVDLTKTEWKIDLGSEDAHGSRPARR